MNYLLTIRNLRQNTIMRDFNFIKEKIKKKDEIWSFNKESFQPIEGNIDRDDSSSSLGIQVPKFRESSNVMSI